MSSPAGWSSRARAPAAVAKVLSTEFFAWPATQHLLGLQSIHDADRFGQRPDLTPDANHTVQEQCQSRPCINRGILHLLTSFVKTRMRSVTGLPVHHHDQHGSDIEFGGTPILSAVIARTDSMAGCRCVCDRHPPVAIATYRLVAGETCKICVSNCDWRDLRIELSIIGESPLVCVLLRMVCVLLRTTRTPLIEGGAQDVRVEPSIHPTGGYYCARSPARIISWHNEANHFTALT
jgi:hypothetical protein